MEEFHKRKTTGIDPIFWYRQWMRVACSECVVEVAAGSLLTHRQIQGGTIWEDRVGAHTQPPPRKAHTYQVYFPKRMLWL